VKEGSKEGGKELGWVAFPRHLAGWPLSNFSIIRPLPIAAVRKINESEYADFLKLRLHFCIIPNTQQKARCSLAFHCKCMVSMVGYNCSCRFALALQGATLSVYCLRIRLDHVTVCRAVSLPHLGICNFDCLYTVCSFFDINIMTVVS